MIKSTHRPVDVTAAALRLVNAPGMTIQDLYNMLQAEQQHQFKDELSELYIDSIQAAITLMEQPMFD